MRISDWSSDVCSSDLQQKLFTTLDAEHFFNARTLASGLTASRLLAAAHSFLVAVGVLGTFVGCTVGLEGLVGTSDEIEALKARKYVVAGKSASVRVVLGGTRRS